MLVFGPFSLDEVNERVLLGREARPLRAKSLAVLRELLRKRDRLVTKEELFGVCWPGTAVSPTVLRVCIREIRALLAEDPTGATVIETIGRRGYRLVARDGDAASPRAPIGRDAELSALRRALARADRGERQLVLVSGEAGLGKSTLLGHFLEETRRTTRGRTACGQCIELAGGAEPYLPVLDVLAHLCGGDASGAVLDTLERYAPSWLLQLPAVAGAGRIERLRERAPSRTRERMLRELADAFEALAADAPLVVALEDLHWSDAASVEALSFLAQRIAPARLLLVGTVRPIDLALGEHPLVGVQRALVARRRASEIALAPLSADDVATYLVQRLATSRGAAPLHPSLASDVHARTGGNPLFLTATVDALLEQGMLTESKRGWQLGAPLDGVIPETLRQLALWQLDRIAPDERQILDAASAAGAEFAAASAAAASGVDASRVDALCAAIAQRTQLVSHVGVDAWPDGTVGSRWAFRHALYRDVLEEALDPARRRALHRAIGGRLEAAWGERAGEIAAELASHFEAAADFERAVRHHVAAAANAKARFAERDVAVHQRAALAYLEHLPDGPERARTELACSLELGAALVATRGVAPGEVDAIHRRALELAAALAMPHARFQAQAAFCMFGVMRADLRRARGVAEDMLATAEHIAVPLLAFTARTSLGSIAFGLGDLDGARAELEKAHALWTPDFPALPVDPTIVCRSMLGFTALHEGRSDEGDAWMRRCLERAESIGSPFNLSYARELAAQYFATAGDRARALAWADAAAPLADEHGFVVHTAVASLVRGWARRDAEALREGIAEYEAAGQLVGTSLFRALRVEVLLASERVDDAVAELDTIFAFVERSGERRHLPELHRLRGECLRRTSASEAAACFAQAVAIAREQGAGLWLQRAEASLAGLGTSH
jgi:DNA-binding winged helix-turn-helix (wHTH) protein/tetratricopeptide (TPR) repeat protein